VRQAEQERRNSHDRRSLIWIREECTPIFKLPFNSLIEVRLCFGAALNQTSQGFQRQTLEFGRCNRASAASIRLEKAQTDKVARKGKIDVRVFAIPSALIEAN
jgi:hypothetical protein